MKLGIFGVIVLLAPDPDCCLSLLQVNLALSLMRSGLARLQPNMDPARLTEGGQLLEAQTAAKQAHLKVGQGR